jgi:Resolvase, N terminal domain
MVGAVIYVRVSTKEQTENLSLPTQLRGCEEYCRRQGYEVLERFHEEGESAKSTDRSQLPEPAHVLPAEQGPRTLRGRVQPDALRAAQVRLARIDRTQASSKNST